MATARGKKWAKILQRIGQTPDFFKMVGAETNKTVYLLHEHICMFVRYVNVQLEENDFHAGGKPPPPEFYNLIWNKDTWKMGSKIVLCWPASACKIWLVLFLTGFRRCNVLQQAPCSQHRFGKWWNTWFCMIFCRQAEKELSTPSSHSLLRGVFSPI